MYKDFVSSGRDIVKYCMFLCSLLVVTNKLRQRSVHTFESINQKLSCKGDLYLVLACLDLRVSLKISL